MFGVRLFPPQVFSDLNFFNVESEDEIAEKFRAVQRVAVATIGAYLFVHYEPILIAQLGSSLATKSVVFLTSSCLSLPTTVLMLSGVCGYQSAMDVLSEIRNGGIREGTVINAAVIGMSYIFSQFYKHPVFEKGPNLLEKLFKKGEDNVTAYLWDRFYKKGVRLFPPQVLSDLNFFNVKSEKQLASRLRAVQRVAAAIIGVYLMVRYRSILAAKLGSSLVAKIAVDEAFVVGYTCLSAPAMGLSMSWGLGYELTMGTLSHSISNREIGKIVIDVALSGVLYILSQIYKDAVGGPDFLERLFQKVEDNSTKFLWDLFYKK